jgi:putative SOS response-associated peptidase YedK
MIPASWYYEWEHLYDDDTGKIRVGSKYRIRPRDASVTWLCGLYRIEDGLPVFTVLTKVPSAEVARIHNRMPLILPADLADRWIFPGTRPETLLSGALTDMVMEKEV